MVINRRTFIIKPGRMEEAVKLIKDTGEGNATAPNRGLMRLSDAIFGPFGVLSMEVEFENLDEYQKYWDYLFGLPQMDKFFETWNVITDAGGTNELWELL